MKKLIFIFVLVLAVNASATDYFFGHDTTAASPYTKGDSSYYLDTVTSKTGSGTLDSAIIYLGYQSGTPDSACVVVYNLDSTFLDSTTRFAITAYPRTAYTVAFVEHGSITANTGYFLGFHLSSEGAGGGSHYYTVGSGTQAGVWFKDSQGSIPSTITAPTKTTNYPLAIGAWYHSGLGPPPYTKKPQGHMAGGSW